MAAKQSGGGSGIYLALLIAAVVLLVPGVIPAAKAIFAGAVNETARKVDDASRGQRQPPAPASEPTVPAQVQLSGLRVIDRPAPDPTYDRALFAKVGSKRFSWTDTNHNSCNTRDDVLLRDVDRTRPYRAEKQGRCPTNMVAGTWHDPYTGEQLPASGDGFTDLTDRRQASAVQIDHVVALATAMRYGAAAWDQQRRIEFANDLDNLQTAASSTNASKSDHDAAAWRPRHDFQCAYANRYILVKDRYDLSVDPSEKRALEEMLGTCS